MWLWCNKNGKRIAYAEEELIGNRYRDLSLFSFFLVPLSWRLFLVSTCFCVSSTEGYGARSFDGLDAEAEKGETAEFMDEDWRSKLWRFGIKNPSLHKREWKFCRKGLKFAEGDDWIWKKNGSSDSEPLWMVMRLGSYRGLIQLSNATQVQSKFKVSY